MLHEVRTYMDEREDDDVAWDPDPGPDGPDFGHQYEFTVCWDALTQAEALLAASVMQAYVRKLIPGSVIEYVNHASGGVE